jgi:D-alanyl-lipoteichoic acid acyltransferase DltB (MBOAT superfamily)
MVFNSLQFVAFFLVVYGLYRVLPHRPQNWLLLIASYYFYAAWDWRFLGLLVASTVIDFCCGLYIASREGRRERKIALLVSIAFNLSMLGFFKYFNFFADNLHALFGLVGWRVDFITLRVLLPIGISFYTFITMSYVIDVYRRHIEPTRNFVDFAVFVAYFPHLVAGPILRASLLLPQVASRRTITREQMVEGAWLTAWGFFKKMFVADNLARVADAIFVSGGHPSGFEVLLGVYAFAFQIYGDFSGYSDIARGISKLMGIELNVNFRFPYFVRTPQEFWQHWHISLSTWLRDYVFLPLSYSFSRTLDGVQWLRLRDDFWIYAAATMITMFLGGLWHGAAWNFVLWGVYQGVLLVTFTLVTGGRRRKKRTRRGGRASRLLKAVGIVGMFHLTCYGWLIFRAKSLPQIGELTSALVARFEPSSAALSAWGLPLLFYAGPLLVVHAFEAAHDDPAVVFRWPLLVRCSVYAAVIYLIVLFGDFAGAQFIYFQF